MKKNVLLFLLITGFTLQAQRYQSSNHEIGFSAGVANYLGDLGSDRGPWFFGQVRANAFRPAFGIFYRNNFHKFLSFRTGLTIGRIYGNDSFSEPGVSGRYERNLHFRSNITDIAMMLEWNILPYKPGHYKHKFTPYLGVGIAGVYYNPKAKLDGQWVNLQPLGTEGQGLTQYPDRAKYAKMAFSIPAAIGFKLNVGRLWAIGAEFQYRHTFVDYLDDVSTSYPDLSYYELNYVEAVANEAISLSYRGNNQDPGNLEDVKRGNSNDSDAYFFIMLNASFRIGDGKNSCPTFK
ncbi:MAG: hypothetical protein ACI9O4_000529 [Chitinophagales bacterium]|jgi:hypothetical protein